MRGPRTSPGGKRVSLPTSPEYLRYGAVTSGPKEKISRSLHESPREGDRLHPPGSVIKQDPTSVGVGEGSSPSVYG